TEIYCHQNAAIFINGTLKANGEKKSGSQIFFSGDRLDDPYKFFPGSWRGIFFSSTSTNNQLNSAIIQNAVQGININGNGNGVMQLTLNSCTITNNQNEGIKAVNSNVYAQNCLITNCGLNNLSLNAGNYNFIFCTVASYSDILVNHSAPVLFVGDTISSTQTAALTAVFTNSIFYGESGSFDDEIQLLRTGNNFNTSFNYVLYKASNIDTSFFKDCISNTDPLFVNIDQEHAEFDFHLMPGSPCINAGSATSITTDIEGNPRMSGVFPDMGCYESQ
ncbi:MAG TPA: choice-of-anchor Q domain-containing protein, partial [Chitinophagaceae bacterium]